MSRATVIVQIEVAFTDKNIPTTSITLPDRVVAILKLSAKTRLPLDKAGYLAEAGLGGAGQVLNVDHSVSVVR